MTIRRQPQDFLVSEVLRAEVLGLLRPSGGSHALYLLDKQSRTTPDAVAALARALHVPAGQVAYAGLKDKHARTRQHVSVPLAARPPEARHAAPAPALSDLNWSATLLGTLPRAIAASDIDHNAFDLVVRDLTPAALSEMDRRAALLRDGADLLIINYFGDQRFGSARHAGGFAGAALVRGDFEHALRLLIGTPARKDSGPRRTLTRALASRWGQWPALAAELPRCPERRAVEALATGATFAQAFAALPNLLQVLSVEAYQSHLWNAAARSLAADAADRAGTESLRTDDDFGEMVFPPAPAARELEHLRMPAPAPGVEPCPPWGEALTAALASEGLTFDDLRIPGLRRPAFGAAERPLVVRAMGIDLSPPARDDLAGKRPMRRVRFALPRGAYATVVLRALGQ
jgi:tRNA pseudouridine13 synthase